MFLKVAEGRQNLVEGRHIAAQTTILEAIFDQLTLLLLRNINFRCVFATLQLQWQRANDHLPP